MLNRCVFRNPICIFVPSLAFVSAFFAACTHTEAAAKGPAPFLWRAEKAGVVTYLFGTIHAGVDADKELPPVVWQSLAESPCFVMEADQDAVDTAALVALGQLPPGESLQAKLTKKTWTRLSARLSPMLGPQGVDRVQPWFAGMLYLQSVLPPGTQMDGVLKARAVKGKKQIGYLENWREAIEAFAKVTGPRDLEEAIAHEGEAEKDIARLVTAYRSGEEAQLGKAMTDLQASAGDDGAQKIKLLLDDRNVAWLPRLEKHIATQGCFVAVGAGHLIGKQSLRTLLSNQGYKISRIGG